MFFLKKLFLVSAGVAGASFGVTATRAETPPEALDAVTVTAERAEEKQSASAVATPVTQLKFSGKTDLQTRGGAETQSDISVRGGTFESTTFSLGAVPVFDPQTGHYLAEFPVAPAMLGAPETRTGAGNAQGGWNATAGSIAYAWLPVENGGSLGLAGGSCGFFSADAYAGFLYPKTEYKKQFGADFAAAFSRDDGAVDLSNGEFSRFNGRLQMRDDYSQTDVFAGYQTKKFAWPNLYAGRIPGGPRREERDDLGTQLYAINHRSELNAAGDWVQFGAFFRVNDDRYSIPVFAYSASHSTHTGGGGFDGRVTIFQNADSGIGTTALRYRAGVVADDLTSDTLTFGKYSSRTQFFAGLYADQSVPVAEKQELVFTAGATGDYSNREGGAVSPTAGIVWKNNASEAMLRRVGLEYSEATQVPSYTALNSAPAGLFGGNSALGRSRSRNVELGADFAAGGNWTISPAVFFRHDSDLVDWVFDPGNPASSRSARNINSDTIGAELAAKGSWSIFDFSFAYAFLHKTDDFAPAASASFYAMNFAEHRLLAGITARLGEGFEIRCDNEFRVQEENVLRSGTRTPVLTSLALIYRLPSVPGLSFSARVDNLWDVYYEAVPLTPGAPRTWSCGVNYVW